MMNNIETMKLALEALRTLHDENMDYLTRNKLGGENNQCMVFAREAITALRQAIEQAQQAEPVACGYDETTGNCTNNPCCYTSPPPRHPLTDEEIALIAAACGGLASDFVVDVARAIEAAHGIKGEA